MSRNTVKAAPIPAKGLGARRCSDHRRTEKLQNRRLEPADKPARNINVAPSQTMPWELTLQTPLPRDLKLKTVQVAPKAGWNIDRRADMLFSLRAPLLASPFHSVIPS